MEQLAVECSFQAYLTLDLMLFFLVVVSSDLSAQLMPVFMGRQWLACPILRLFNGLVNNLKRAAYLLWQ